MERICARCGKHLHENDFLCPDCGAIYGQPEFLPKLPPAISAHKVDKPAEAVKTGVRSWSFGLVALSLLLIFVAIILLNPFGNSSMDQIPTTSTSSKDFIISTSLTIPKTDGPTIPMVPTIPTISTAPTEPTEPIVPPEPAITAEFLIESFRERYYPGQTKIYISVNEYGVYNDRYVLNFAVYFNLDHRQEVIQNIGGHYFYYPSNEYLLVYYGGRFWDFEAAVESYGWFTMQQEQEIFEQHRQIHDVYYVPPSPNIPAPDFSFDTLQMLKERYISSMAEAGIGITSLHIQLYAVFGDLYICSYTRIYDVSIAPPGGVVNMFVGDYTFTMHYGTSLLVFDGEKFHSLEFLYMNQVISEDQLRQLFLYYRQENWQFYYDGDMLPVDFNTVDWRAYKAGDIDLDRYFIQWNDWMKNWASPEQLVDLSHANVGSAMSVQVSNVIAERFASTPVDFIRIVALEDEALQERFIHDLIFSEYYTQGLGIDLENCLALIDPNQLTTDAQRALAEAIGRAWNEYMSGSIPPID